MKSTAVPQCVAGDPVAPAWCSSLKIFGSLAGPFIGVAHRQDTSNPTHFVAAPAPFLSWPLTAWEGFPLRILCQACRWGQDCSPCPLQSQKKQVISLALPYCLNGQLCRSYPMSVCVHSKHAVVISNVTLCAFEAHSLRFRWPTSHRRVTRARGLRLWPSHRVRSSTCPLSTNHVQAPTDRMLLASHWQMKFCGIDKREHCDQLLNKHGSFSEASTVCPEKAASICRSVTYASGISSSFTVLLTIFP